MQRALELHRRGVGPAKVIARLLEVWRVRPAPELARAIERLAATVPRAALPESTDEFLRRAIGAGAGAPAELGALLACVRTRWLNDTRLRVDALRSLGPDPRVASALADFLRDVPYTSSSSQPLWDVVLDVLAGTRDPRVIDRLDDIHAGKQIRDAMKAWLHRRVERLHARLVERFPEGGPTLDAAELLALFEIAGEGIDAEPTPDPPAPNRTRDALIAAVYAHPDDDGPRLVLADHLQIEGDPYGELIALQCHRAPDDKPSARERELLSKHGKAWLGELSRHIHSKCAFRRGFLAQAQLKVNSPREAEWARELPGWATVESLTLGGWAGEEIPRTVRGIRELHGIGVLGLRSLLGLPHLRPRVLGFGRMADYVLWRELESSPVSSELRSVRGAPSRFVAASKLLPQLEEVVFEHGLGGDHVELAARNPHLRVVARSPAGEMVVRIDADGLIAVTVHVARSPPARVHLGVVRDVQVLVTQGRSKVIVVREALEAWIATMPALLRWDLTSAGGTKGRRTSSAPVTATTGAPRLKTTPKLPALAWTARGIVVPYREGVALLEGDRGSTIAKHVCSDHQEAAVARSGRAVAIAGPRTDVFDPVSGDRLGSFPRESMQGMSDDGALVFAGTGARDVATGALRWTAPDGSRCVALAEAHARAVVRTNERLAILDLETGAVRFELAKGWIESIAVDADAERVAVLGRDHHLYVVDVPTAELCLEVEDAWEADGAHFAPGVAIAGGAVATASKTGGLVVFDASGRRRRLVDGEALDAAFSPDGARLCVKLFAELCAVDVASGRVVWRASTA